MKLGFSLTVFIALAAVPSGFAQSASVEPTPNPHKVVVTNSMPPVTRIATPTVRPRVVVDDNEEPTEPTVQGPSPIAPAPSIDETNVPKVSLSFLEIKNKIAEAKRQLQSKPQLIVSEDPKLQKIWPRIAFMDPRTSRIDFISLNKDNYLKTGAVTQAVSTDGRLITVRTIRANGVNTPFQLVDNNGVAQLPLIDPVSGREGRSLYRDRVLYVDTSGTCNSRRRQRRQIIRPQCYRDRTRPAPPKGHNGSARCCRCSGEVGDGQQSITTALERNLKKISLTIFLLCMRSTKARPSDIGKLGRCRRNG